MKKLIFFLGIIAASSYLAFLSSCCTDCDMETENTFNLESLEVDPSADINDNFVVTYGVTTTGFPQFLFDFYLSNDDQLDAGDLKIAEGLADKVTSPGSNVVYMNQVYFRSALEPVTNAIKFTHSFNQTEWEGETTTEENLSGKIKYIIGRFYHTQGLHIMTLTTRISVRVKFE